MSADIALWRIATETREYRANDLSGRGAAKYPGRWNAAGEHVIYASVSLALAVLETAAHIDDAHLPLNRFVVRIIVPASVWRKRRALRESDLDPAWCAIPPGRASLEAGSGWYRSQASAILLVPSVIVPEEPVVLVNASHPEARRLRAEVVRPFEFNRLFRA